MPSATPETIRSHVAPASHWLHNFLRGRTRIAIAWIAGLAVVALLREYPAPLWLLPIAVGTMIRVWAGGFLRKDSRPAVGGPYRWTRNPLYLGTYLMAVGVAGATGSLALLALVSALFAGLYRYIILDEELKLREIFGEPYVRYCARVPRFLPWRGPASGDRLAAEVNPDPAARRYDPELAHRNYARDAWAAGAALAAALYLVPWLWGLLDG